MAKIKFGMMMTDARGKLGGQVFSKNGAGSYVRTKVTPTNPQTSAQSAVRSLFAQISAGWSGLTTDQRSSFNTKVGDYSTTNVFGDLVNPTGKSLYQRLNQNLGNSEQALINTCPSPIAIPSGLVESTECSVAGENLDIVTDGDSTNSKVLVFATPVLSDGTSFVKNKLRQIGVADGGNNVSIDVWSEYVAKYGTPTSSANIYIGIKFINAQGQASPLQTAKLTLVA